ncbi:hypothetical protein [Sphingobium sp. Sx8-8]|uniref:hypothetical protein n=1 Tax=Sphingobium sp. Sx8-8 TaxID=2933617 RepID=UPI001F569DE4|nr:hypothetical protein [Sphingobium sp. Sx8-8]
MLIALLTLTGTMPVLTMSLAATPPAEGTMAVSATNVDGSEDASSDIFRDAAASALAARGFTLLDGSDHAAYRMELIVHISEVGTGNAKVAPSHSDLMSGGVAGAVGSIFKVPLPSSKSQHVALERTQLDMNLRKRGGEEVIWHGKAVTVRPAGTQQNIASELCNALLRAYPAQSEDVIGVP